MNLLEQGDLLAKVAHYMLTWDEGLALFETLLFAEEHLFDTFVVVVLAD